MPRLRRLSALFVFAGLAAVLSGCVSIKSQSRDPAPAPASSRCASTSACRDRDRTARYTDVRAAASSTAESDNGVRTATPPAAGAASCSSGSASRPAPAAPANFVTTDGSLSFARSASYTERADTTSFPPAAGFRWDGYLSTDAPFDPANVGDRSTVAGARIRSAGGCERRAVRESVRVACRDRHPRQTGPGAANPSDAVLCNPLAGTVCFDSPSAGVASSLIKSVSDIGVLPGVGVTAGQGETATVDFPISNRDSGGLGNRTVALSATTTVPGAAATTAAPTISVAANATPTTAVRVVVPPATPAGTYDVVLTAHDQQRAEAPR